MATTTFETTTKAKPFFMLSPNSAGEMQASKDRGRARWGIQYQAGASIWSNTDAIWFAELAAASIVASSKRNFSQGKGLDDQPRTRKQSWTYPHWDKKAQKTITIKEFQQLDQDIVDGNYPGKKPRAPRAPRTPRSQTAKAQARYNAQKETYSEKQKAYRHKVRHWIKSRADATKRKSNFRYKGRMHTPTLSGGPLNYSGILIESVATTRPTPSRSRSVAGKKAGTTTITNTSGWLKITTDKKREWVVQRKALFSYGDGGSVQAKIARAIHTVHTDAHRGVSWRQAGQATGLALQILLRVATFVATRAAAL